MRNWRILSLSAVLTAATILVMYLDPLFAEPVFEFSPPVWDGASGSLMIVAIPALFLLTMALTSHGLKYRYLLSRLVGSVVA